MAGLGPPNYPKAGDDGCGAALRGWNGPWMAFGLLPQIEWAKCSLGVRTGNIPFD